MMLKIKIASKPMRYLSIVLSVLLLTAVLLTSLQIPVKGEKVLLSETNPELDFKLYDSKANSNNYIPTGTYTQGDGVYSITTNANVMWDTADDIAILYKKYNVGYGDKGTITIQGTVTERYATDGNEPHENASVGLNIRCGDSNDAPEIYLHVRGLRIMIVYRTTKGAFSAPSYQFNESAVYPVQLKMEKKGNAVTCSYKNGNSDVWCIYNKIYISSTEDIMAGIAVHSCEEKQDLVGTVTDYSVEIKGPDDAPDYSTGDGDVDNDDDESIVPVQPDPEYADDLLLRETFTDGSLINEPEAKDNVIWGEKGSDADYATLEVEDDNRVWHRNFSDDYYMIGDQSWTDYKMSTRFKYGPDCDTDAKNSFSMFVRHKTAKITGYYSYSATVEFGNTVVIRKKVLSSNKGLAADNLGTAIMATATLEESLFDGKWHTMEVTAFDNVITVALDGEEILSVVDDGFPIYDAYTGKPYRLINSAGCVGIGSIGTDIFIDDIYVYKLYDALGGDYDNSIDGNWDLPIPDYVVDYNK